MSKPSFYDKLTDAEKKEYDEKISAITQEKESYVSRHSELWKKFLEGEARLTDFPRDSKTASSQHQYFFTRNGKTCFQYKSFVKDMLEAIAHVEDLSSQRKSMMKYELVRFLQPQRTSRAGDRSGAGVEVNKEVEELNAIGRAKEAEKKAKQVADNLNKSAIAKELNSVTKAKEEPIITTRPSFEQMTPQRTADGKKVICPFNANDPKSDKWLEQHPHIDAELVVFKDEV
jgi:hypothetical protein